MHFRSTLILLFALLPILAFAAPSSEDQRWSKFKTKYKKHYRNQVAETRRRKTFETRASQIDKHNAAYKKGLKTFTMGINEFADKTDAELKVLLGTVPPPSVQARSDAQEQILVSRKNPVDRQSEPVQTIVDLRTHKCMSPIKAQMDCGACWAFAAINIVEFANCLKGGLTSPVILSEQNLVDCTYTRDGCTGGFYTAAWDNANNIANNASYPYTSGKTETWSGSCKFKPETAVAKVSSHQFLADEAGIELALNKSEPVAVSIQVVGDDFMYYKSGIYSDIKLCNSTIGKDVNHAITLVGYNNTNNPPYWILRNSWGLTWGMSGYMYLQKNINLCNVGVYAYGSITLK